MKNKLIDHIMELRCCMIILSSFICMILSQLVTATDQQDQQFLYLQNAIRGAVPVPKLVWDESIAAYAREYANQRSGDCQLIHSNGPYGENIYTGFGAGYSEPSAAVKWWADEKQYYDYDSNSCSGQDCRHYTQMVWKDSKRLGCASVNCGNGNTFITCNYDPPGNWDGQRPY